MSGTLSSSQPRSRRACSDPIGNGPVDGNRGTGIGCTICCNNDKYGFGSSVCGRCNRCHGCGSSNNGIGPIQAVYFGGKKIVKKMTATKSKEGGMTEGKVEGGA
ncbi:unnamed protein product [Cercospora beticola]|nr:unnamed protein product [Cercospora beticola]